MALCPFATQKPVSAHGGPIGTILGVVIHVTAGEGDPFNEFANPANQVSSHFGIGNGQGGMADGALEQYVDTGNESWAQMAGNSSYISVETEGEPTDPLTPAQVATFGRLMAWLAQTHGVELVITDTPGARGFLTHGDGGAAWGNHLDCPGPQRSAQRAAILAAAQPTTTPTEGDDDMGVSNDWLVRNCYRTVLHREVDPDGYTTWTGFLAGGGDPGEMWARIQDSAEGQIVLAAERKAMGLG